MTPFSPMRFVKTHHAKSVEGNNTITHCQLYHRLSKEIEILNEADPVWNLTSLRDRVVYVILKIITL